MDFATRLLHVGVEIDKHTGAASIPVYQASTFHQEDVDLPPEFEYSRSGNPTRRALEEVIAHLESGTAGFAFASGMAAIAASLLIFSQGDHLLAPKDVYGGTYRILTKACGRWGIGHTLVDTTDFSQLEKALTPNTKALFLESPSNPLLKVSDLPRLCAWAREKGLLTIVDNTFMTPYLQRPLEFGADVVVHSATKFLGGHSDVVAGLVVVKDKKLAADIQFIQNSLGGILGPQDSWLTLRGIKTLKVRMDASEKSARIIAQGLAASPYIKAVHYPGLASHPGHALLKAQAAGFGAVLSFDLGTEKLAKAVMKGVKLPIVAVSLGAVESILSYPATMSHSAIPAPVRHEMGIGDGLLRLSVGLENAEDILQDILSAVEKSAEEEKRR